MSCQTFQGPPNVNFKGPHAILRAIGRRTRLILTPAGGVGGVGEGVGHLYGEGRQMSDMIENY